VAERVAARVVAAAARGVVLAVARATEETGAVVRAEVEWVATFLGTCTRAPRRAGAVAV